LDSWGALERMHRIALNHKTQHQRHSLAHRRATSAPSARSQTVPFDTAQPLPWQQQQTAGWEFDAQQDRQQQDEQGGSWFVEQQQRQQQVDQQQHQVAQATTQSASKLVHNSSNDTAAPDDDGSNAAAVAQLADRLASVLRPTTSGTLPHTPQPTAPGSAPRGRPPPARPPALSPPTWRPAQQSSGRSQEVLFSPMSATSGISREGSTTEVVSVQPSEGGSTILSAEQSLASVHAECEGGASAPATPRMGAGLEGDDEGEGPVEEDEEVDGCEVRQMEVKQEDEQRDGLGRGPQQGKGSPASGNSSLPTATAGAGAAVPLSGKQPHHPKAAAVHPPPPRQLPLPAQPPQPPAAQRYEPLPLTEPVPQPQRPQQPPQQPSLQSRQPQPRASGVPLFVPVVVCMDEEDHLLVAEEALECQGRCVQQAGGAGEAGCAGADGGGGAAAAGCGASASAAGASNGGAAQPRLDEALRRARVIQDYLTSFEAQGLPVVRLQYGVEGVDRIHEYILQCIQVAMAL